MNRYEDRERDRLRSRRDERRRDGDAFVEPEPRRYDTHQHEHRHVYARAEQGLPSRFEGDRRYERREGDRRYGYDREGYAPWSYGPQVAEGGSSGRNAFGGVAVGPFVDRARATSSWPYETAVAFDEEDDGDDGEDDSEDHVYTPHDDSVYFAGFGGFVAAANLNGIIHRPDPEHYLRTGLIRMGHAYARALDHEYNDIVTNTDTQAPTNNGVNVLGWATLMTFSGGRASSLSPTHGPRFPFGGRHRLMRWRHWRHQARATIGLARAAVIWENTHINPSDQSGSPTSFFFNPDVVPSPTSIDGFPQCPSLQIPAATQAEEDLDIPYLPGNATVYYTVPQAQVGDTVIFQPAPGFTFPFFLSFNGAVVVPPGGIVAVNVLNFSTDEFPLGFDIDGNPEGPSLCTTPVSITIIRNNPNPFAGATAFSVGFFERYARSVRALDDHCRGLDGRFRGWREDSLRRRHERRERREDERR